MTKAKAWMKLAQSVGNSKKMLPRKNITTHLIKTLTVLQGHLQVNKILDEKYHKSNNDTWSLLKDDNVE